jgi:hypothetical protein
MWPNDETVPPLKSGHGGSDPSANSSAAAADPLDALAGAVGETSEPVGKGEAPGAASPPTLSVEAYEPVAEYIFGVVEAYAIDKWGEEMRASDKQRAGIVHTGAQALQVYAPLLLAHPAAPFAMAFVLGWYLPNIRKAKKAKAARDVTPTHVPTARTQPPPPWDRTGATAEAAPQPDHAGGGWQGQGQEHLDQV